MAIVAVQVDASDFTARASPADVCRAHHIGPDPHPHSGGPLGRCPALDLALRARFCSCRSAWPVCAPAPGKRVGGGGGCWRSCFPAISRRRGRSARDTPGAASGCPRYVRRPVDLLPRLPATPLDEITAAQRLLAIRYLDLSASEAARNPAERRTARGFTSRLHRRSRVPRGSPGGGIPKGRRGNGRASNDRDGRASDLRRAVEWQG